MSPAAKAVLRWSPLMAMLLLLAVWLLDPAEWWRKFSSAWFNKDGLEVALGLFALLSPLTISLFRGQRHFVLLAVALTYLAYEALIPPYGIRADLLFLWPAMAISVLRWYEYSKESHGSE